jgi:hypothetical protein
MPTFLNRGRQGQRNTKNNAPYSTNYSSFVRLLLALPGICAGFIFESFCKIFGNIKKIFTSLHCKQNINRYMLQKQTHIEAAKSFSPNTGYTICGACKTDE